MLRKIRILGFSAILVFILPELARADVALVESPVNWRLQNILGDGLVVYFSSSSCANGELVFGASVTSDDKNRFWSLVLTAKANGSTVGVFYNNPSGICAIS